MKMKVSKILILVMLFVFTISSVSYAGFFKSIARGIKNSIKNPGKSFRDVGSLIKGGGKSYSIQQAPKSAQEQRADQAKATARGLLDAGLSAEAIVANLKNMGRSEMEIGIACLGANMNASEVYDALIEAGFSEEQAASAIPASIRISIAEPSDEEAIANSPVTATISELIGPASASASEADAQIVEAGKITRSLLNDDCTLSDISKGLAFNGFSKAQIAQVFKKAGISSSNVYAVMLTDSRGTDKDVIDGLVSAGYDRRTLVNACIKQAQAEGRSAGELLNSLTSESASKPQNPNLAAADSDKDGILSKSELSQIALNPALGGLFSSPSAIKDGVSLMTQSLSTGVSIVKRSFSFLGGLFGGSSGIRVAKAVEPEEKDTKGVGDIVRSMLSQGYEFSDMGQALKDNGYGKKGTAKILKEAGVTASAAYKTMAAINQSPSESTETTNVDLGETVEVIETADKAVAVVDGGAAEQETVVVEAKPAPAIDKSIVDALVSAGYSERSIFNASIGQARAEGAFATDVFNSLAVEPGAPQAASNSWVGDRLSESYNPGKTIFSLLSQSFSFFGGLFGSHSGLSMFAKAESKEIYDPNAKNITRSGEILSSMLSQGYEVSAVTQALTDNGYSQKQVAQVLKKAGVTASAAYTAIVGNNKAFVETAGEDQAEVAAPAIDVRVVDDLVSAGYSRQSVLNVSIKQARAEEVSATEVFSSLMIEYPKASQGGSSSTWGGLFARRSLLKYSVGAQGKDIAKSGEIISGMLNQGYSLSESAIALQNNDFSNDEISQVFKKANVSALRAYQTMLDLNSIY